MFKLAKLLLVATVSTICATAKLIPTKFPIPFELQADPVTTHPGALFASLKLSSLNNILQLMAPLLANEILQGKEIALDINKSIAAYGLNLGNVTIVTVSSDFVHSLSWKENAATPTAFLDVSGFDINGTLDGNVTGLPKIMNFKGFSIMNITLQLEVALPQTAAQDGVHFSIVGHPNFNIGNLQLDVKQLTWQFVINKAMPMVVSGINYGLNFAEGAIEAVLWGVNQKLDNPDLFVVKLTDKLPALNITATKAPEMDSTTDLINIWLDGRFVDPTTGQPTELVNDVAPVRITDGKQREQIFIHQSMIDSVLFEMYKMENTMKANDNIRAQLLQIFFELGQYYGTDVQFYLDLTFDKTAGEVVQFDTEKGIMIGNLPGGGLKTNLVISCTNATTTTPEKAVEMNLEVAANVNAAWNSFVITASVNDIAISNTQVTYDLVGLDSHDFDPLLTGVFKGMADDFNLVHKDGLNLVEKYPTLGFISGMARNNIISPLVQEQFVYAGFKWISDMGDAEEVVRQFVQ